MTGHVYAVASGKGGVGKTTTVINLGVTLRMADHSVALVDADLGMANLSTLLGIEHEPTIHDVLAGDADLDDAIIEKAEGFGIVPGNRALSRFAEADPAGLNEIVETLAERYDYVLVDTASGLSQEAVQPLVPANGVILVTEPNQAAIGDTKKTVELVELVGGTILGVVVTKSYEGVDSAGIAATLGTEVLAEIPVDPAVASSLAAEKPLQGHNPDGPAAAAYRQLANRLSAGQVAATGDGATSDDASASPGAADDTIEESVDAAASDGSVEPAAAGDEREAGGPSVDQASEGEIVKPLLDAADEEIGLEADSTEGGGGADDDGDEGDDIEREVAEPAEDDDEVEPVAEPEEDLDVAPEDEDEEVGEVEGDEEQDLPVGDEDEGEDDEDLDAAVTWGDDEEDTADGDDDEAAEAEDEDILDALAEVTEVDEGEEEEAEDEDGVTEGADEVAEEVEEGEEQRSGGIFARFRRLFR